MNKQAIFIDNVHEYDYLLDDETYTLYYSEGEQWSSRIRGEIAVSIKNTGNGLIITSPQKKKNNFDYGEAAALYILLKIIHRKENYKIEIANKEVI